MNANDNFDSFHSDNLNEDRLNPAVRSKSLEYLKATIALLKKCLYLSDKILP